MALGSFSACMSASMLPEAMLTYPFASGQSGECRKNELTLFIPWEDPAPRKGEAPSYYYVRVVQKDGQMAWASPIWVQVGK
jgi:hypothetical protein